ncbi:MAG: membrane dipeptidase [Saprospirales bacterium]|nr:MAG: membrane dipeptidase [Saprospirales bacterium]
MVPFIFLIFALFAFTELHTNTKNDPVERIHRNILTLDTHVDTPMGMVRGFDVGIRNDEGLGGGQLDFPRMKEGGLDAAFFAVFVRQRERNPETYTEAYENMINTFSVIHREVAKYNEMAGIALNPNDAYQLKEEGMVAVFIGLENGFSLEYKIERVQEVYDLGARYIGLSHTSNNQISDSSTDGGGSEHNGLSDFGKQVVKEMNRIGMLIDVSHISDEAFWDVLEISEHPVVATHSNARAICDHPRNLTDEMVIALAERGGVVQITFLPSYVKTIEQKPEVLAARRAVREKYNNFRNLDDETMAEGWAAWQRINEEYPVKLPTVSDFVDHIDHIVELVGIDYVGIGSDFDGGGILEDCRDVSEMKNITRELLARGYSEEDIEKIWSGNFFRVFNEVIATSSN